MFNSYYLDAENINLIALTSYLKCGDWTLNEDFPNKKLLLFSKTYENETFNITLPAKDTFSDYKRRLKDSINLLSELDELSPEEIINKIYQLESNTLIKEKNFSIPKGAKDTLSFRIICNESENGSLPLAYTESVLSGMKKLFLSAIYSEKNVPTPIGIPNFKNAYNELSNYRMAQTNVGSFIFNIDIELDDIDLQVSFDTTTDANYAITKSRKIIKRIQNGISDICESNFNTTLADSYTDSYLTGLNATMCDAILAFKNEIPDIILESSVKWSKELPAPKEIKEKVIVKSNDFILLETLSKIYKEKGVQEVETSGFIIQMHNSFNKNGKATSKKATRYIIIAAIINNSVKQVKVYLDEHDYIIACQAHSNQSEISIIGLLESRGNNLIINKYSLFKSV